MAATSFYFPRSKIRSRRTRARQLTHLYGENIACSAATYSTTCLKRCFGDASVQRTPRLAQKGAVGRILDQRVLKEITRMRRHALTKQQASPNDPIQSWPQLLLGLAHDGSQQSVSELASYRRSDLRDLFVGAKPVEPRHAVRAITSGMTS